VAYIEAAGVAAWTRAIFPATFCPDGHASVSLTNNSKLMFTITTTAQLFSYIADGVPLGSLQLLVNESSGRPVPGGGYPWRFDSLLVPIAQPAVDGARSLVIARMYAGNVTDRERPPLRPVARIFVAAVDQHDTATYRLQFVWTQELALPPALAACAPIANGPFPGAEPLLVTGPVVGPNHTMVVGLACNTSALTRGNTTFYGIAVDAPWPAVPAVLWSATLQPASPLSPMPFNGSSVGAAYPLMPSMALDPRMYASGAPAVAWTTFVGASDVVAVSVATGQPVDWMDIVSLLRSPASANASTCALAPLVQQSPPHGVFWYFTTSLLASTLATSNASGVMVTAGGVAGPALPVQTPENWVLALALPAAGGNVSVAWCTPTPADGVAFNPGHFALTGQPAPVASTLVVAMPDAVYGLEAGG
jgi:hypothetical protein